MWQFFYQISIFVHCSSHDMQEKMDMLPQIKNLFPQLNVSLFLIHCFNLVMSWTLFFFSRMCVAQYFCTDLKRFSIVNAIISICVYICCVSLVVFSVFKGHIVNYDGVVLVSQGRACQDFTLWSRAGTVDAWICRETLLSHLPLSLSPALVETKSLRR